MWKLLLSSVSYPGNPLVGIVSTTRAKLERALATDFYKAITTVCTKFRHNDEARTLAQDAAANPKQQQYVFQVQPLQAMKLPDVYMQVPSSVQQHYVPVQQQMQQQQPTLHQLQGPPPVPQHGDLSFHLQEGPPMSVDMPTFTDHKALKER